MSAVDLRTTWSLLISPARPTTPSRSTGQTDTFDTSTYNTIVVDTGGGSDSLTVNLSSLADTATLNGTSGSITSSNYAISYTNVETTLLTAARAIK